MTALRYEPETKTIRTVRENYWIATVDTWDKAIAPEEYAADLVHRYNVHEQLVSLLKMVDLRLDLEKKEANNSNYILGAFHENIKAALHAAERN